MTYLLPGAQAVFCYRAVICPESKEQTTGAKDQDSLHVRCAEKVLVAGVVTIIVASIDVSSTKTGEGYPRLLTYKSILLSI